jgi:hypothetical protein
MNRNFFVRLVFATHRVADALADKEVIQEVRGKANTVLVDLILFTEKEMLASGRKRELVSRLQEEVRVLILFLDELQKKGLLDSKNFSILRAEYEKIQEFLEMFRDLNMGLDVAVPVKSAPPEPIVPEIPAINKIPTGLLSSQEGDQRGREDKQKSLTGRQQKIVEFLKVKERAQVWELQKILPEVTKRTLRRDLDELLQKKLVERKGEWNAVAYELKVG